jgi:hypothetical protein
MVITVYYSSFGFFFAVPDREFLLHDDDECGTHYLFIYLPPPTPLLQFFL